jgi:hypothetical protein
VVQDFLTPGIRVSSQVQGSQLVHLKQVNVVQIVHLIQIFGLHLILQVTKILSYYYYTCMGFFYRLFIYVLPLEIQYKRGRLEYPRHIFVSALSQELDFQSHVMFFFYYFSGWVKMRGNSIYLLTGYEGIANLLSPRHWLLTEAKPRWIVRVEGTTNLLFPNTQSINILLYRKTFSLTFLCYFPSHS